MLSFKSPPPMEELGVTMAFSNLFKKATNLLGIGSPEDNKPPPLDGEIIYCKNNVCVHPPARLSTETKHHPGYLNIRSQDDDVLGSTLILTWIPNSTLQRNPRSIENSPAIAKISPRRSPRQEYAKSEEVTPSPDATPSPGDSAMSSPEHQTDGKATHQDSISSEGSDGQSDRTKEELSESVKSQADSGILSASSILSQPDFPSHFETSNNERQVSDLPKTINVGQNVNTIHKDKDINIKSGNINERPASTGSMSSESDFSTEGQYNALINRNVTGRVKHPVAEQIRDSEKRKRSSSNRSVTSIEMEGDNLVVVTEEIGDDSTFIEDGEEIDTDNHNEQGDGVKISNGDNLLQPKLLSTDNAEKTSLSSDSTASSPSIQRYQRMLRELQNGTECNTTDNAAEISTDFILPQEEEKSQMERLKDSLDLKLNLEGITNDQPMISITDISQRPRSDSSCSSTPTSGPDSGPPSPFTPPYYSPGTPSSGKDLPFGSETDSEPISSSQACYSSPEGMETTHNMCFPENSVNFGAVNSPSGTPAGGKSVKDQICGVFSVDLGQMRSLRVFFSDDKCSSGQLVIASRESQYKILHFHHGGLDRLADTFSDWTFLAQPAKAPSDLDLHCKHFSVIRPHLSHGQSHPEEGAYEPVNEETWKQHMNELGQIQDDFHLRKAIFFAGLEPGLRHEMWPFLLHYYPYNSTIEDREQIRNDKYIEYQNLRKQRESLSQEEQDRFWRSVQCTVEKDVVRTDRSHPYFKGEDNPNILVLKNILLNYATAHPLYGYTQGMSDLLSPILVEVQNEVDAYWCFVGLMQKTIFVSSPKDIDMDKQLIYLRALIQVMLPEFYDHLCSVQDGLELLFCHRWILLCYKREFPEIEALRMWEACWAHYQTDYFHLFICVAIIAVYGEDVVQQTLPSDEMLLHFSSLSMHMNGAVILKKARGLLHQFRTLPKIPCMLEGLCTLCGSGMWDSGHVPTIECVGNHQDDLCPYGGKPSKALS